MAKSKVVSKKVNPVPKPKPKGKGTKSKGVGYSSGGDTGNY